MQKNLTAPPLTEFEITPCLLILLNCFRNISTLKSFLLEKLLGFIKGNLFRTSQSQNTFEGWKLKTVIEKSLSIQKVLKIFLLERIWEDWTLPEILNSEGFNRFFCWKSKKNLRRKKSVLSDTLARIDQDYIVNLGFWTQYRIKRIVAVFDFLKTVIHFYSFLLF